MPLYLKGVLNTGAENTVFVFAPAALGLLIGLRAAPVLARAIGGPADSDDGVDALCRDRGHVRLRQLRADVPRQHAESAGR